MGQRSEGFGGTIIPKAKVGTTGAGSIHINICLVRLQGERRDDVGTIKNSGDVHFLTHGQPGSGIGGGANQRAPEISRSMTQGVSEAGVQNGTIGERKLGRAGSEAGIIGDLAEQIVGDGVMHP